MKKGSKTKRFVVFAKKASKLHRMLYCSYYFCGKYTEKNNVLFV